MRHALPCLALLALCACSSGGKDAGDDGSKFAGLPAEIAQWRNAIEAESAVCKAKQDGKGCADFAVACKREREITPAEQAKGVTAKLVAAMTYDSLVSGKPGSAFAEFSRAGGTWTRTEAGPVNLSTCEASPA